MKIRKNDKTKTDAFKAQKVVRVPSAEGQYAPRAVQDAAARVALAEIIGWEETTKVDVIGLRGHHRPGCVGYDPGICECMQTPDVDDMLMWLREQGWDVYVAAVAKADHVSVDLYHRDYWRKGKKVGPGQSAPTLHAALEATVVAVGKATDA